MEKKPYWTETIERSYFFRKGEAEIKKLFKIPEDEKICSYRISPYETYIGTQKITYDRRKI